MGEAVHTTCYLINRSPSTALNFKTPQEVWTGKPPSYQNLRVFGCPAFFHVNEGKLEPRSRRGLFMGYPDGVKGYRIWSIEEKKCIISRDVVFNESKLLEESKSNEVLEESSTIQDAQLEVELGTDQAHRQSSTEIVEPVDTQETNEKSSSETEEEETEQEYMLCRDKARREIKPPSRFGYESMTAYACLNNDEPNTYNEAMNSKDHHKWKEAMMDEMESLAKNQNWKLVNKPTRASTTL